MRFVLFPFSFLYWVVIFLRNLFYNIGLLKIRLLPCYVISVGNLTTGGTGKTPTVISLTKFLRNNGFSVAVLSRGYGRTSAGTIIVSDGQTLHQSWQETGDEPLMIAEALPNIPIVVDGNRYRGGKLIIEKFHPDIILLDDAYQHRAVHRDLNILLISAESKKEEACLLPAGNLREPKHQTSRADLIFISKSNLFQSLEMKDAWGNFPQHIPAFQTSLETISTLNSTTGKVLAVHELSGKKVLAVSALGSPKGFERSLFASNAIITDHLVFRDHHTFTKKDVNNIFLKKTETKADFVITTDKDFIKLRHLISDLFALYSLSVEIDIPPKAQDTILSKINIEK